MLRLSRILILGVLLAILPAGCSGRGTLILREAESNQVIAQWDLEPDETFSVEFIHSVNQSPVIDVFTAEGETLKPVKTIYSSLGAGVQSELRPGERLSYDESGRMVISGFQQTFESLNFIVGTVSDHVLTIRGRRISLRELCGRNAAVTFTIKP